MDNDITALLRAWQQGDTEAANQLAVLVRQRLHDLAAQYLRHEARAHSWQTSDLVQEAWLKLARQDATWQDRDHFFGIAARQMRQLLVGYARARQTDKRGGDWLRVAFAESCEITNENLAALAPLEDALQALEAKDEQKARIVELRYFAGLSVEETARVLGLSVSTVIRQWRTARLWLRRELTQGETDET